MFSSPRVPQGQQAAYTKGLTLFNSALDQWLSCYNATPSTGGARGSDGHRSSSGEHARVSSSFPGSKN